MRHSTEAIIHNTIAGILILSHKVFLVHVYTVCDMINKMYVVLSIQDLPTTISALPRLRELNIA